MQAAASKNAGSREGRCRQERRPMQHAAKGDAAACVLQLS
jgi:hypothetical protein